MFIKDPTDLMIFPKYIQDYLNGEYISDDHPEKVIEFEPMYRLNADKTAQEWFAERVTLHNAPRGLLDIIFDKPFNNPHGDFRLDGTMAMYYGLDAINKIYATAKKGSEAGNPDSFKQDIIIPITDMKYPVDDDVNIKSGPSDMFKYIENNTFDMIVTARRSFAASFASYCLSEDALDDDDVAGIKTKIDKILKAYKPDYKEEEFNWKSPYLFPMVESIYNKLPEDKKAECDDAFNALASIHQSYYDIGYEEILSKTRMEYENCYDITIEIYKKNYQHLLDKITKRDQNEQLRRTSETLIFIEWVLDKYEESKK